MECKAYCTASSYDLLQLNNRLKKHSRTAMYRDVLHLTSKEAENPADIFFFSFGAVVFWNINHSKQEEILNLLKPFEHQPREEAEIDEFTYVYGTIAKISGDEITLPNNEGLTKLAISHGIAQSVKLSTFEAAIQIIFNRTKYIPEELALQGKISLSKNEIRKIMGQLFIERNSINLHGDLLDTPEFFWEYSELEPLYSITSKYLDIDTRAEVLNQRLTVVKELFEMLGSEINHMHSSRLEWTIIWLIIIEVVIILLKDVFHFL